MRDIRIRNKGDHLGIQLVGGNKVGIFISSIMEDSPAEYGGVMVGDLIVKVLKYLKRSMKKTLKKLLEKRLL